jgi:hypothetical protein
MVQSLGPDYVVNVQQRLDGAFDLGDTQDVMGANLNHNIGGTLWYLGDTQDVMGANPPAELGCFLDVRSGQVGDLLGAIHDQSHMDGSARC